MEDAGQSHRLSHRHLLELVHQPLTLHLFSDPTPGPHARGPTMGSGINLCGVAWGCGERHGDEESIELGQVQGSWGGLQ